MGDRRGDGIGALDAWVGVADAVRRAGGEDLHVGDALSGEGRGLSGVADVDPVTVGSSGDAVRAESGFEHDEGLGRDDDAAPEDVPDAGFGTVGFGAVGEEGVAVEFEAEDA